MSENIMAICRPFTWRDRLRIKLFPPDYVELPKAPPTHKDVLISHSYVELSVSDRLRVFLTGRVKVEAKTVTENIIGDCIANTKIYALPPKWASDDEYRIPNK